MKLQVAVLATLAVFALGCASETSSVVGPSDMGSSLGRSDTVGATGGGPGIVFLNDTEEWALLTAYYSLDPGTEILPVPAGGYASFPGIDDAPNGADGRWLVSYQIYDLFGAIVGSDTARGDAVRGRSGPACCRAPQ